jgi:CO dehydrogenase/acetyl-CoA synthase delta subunit
MTAADGTAARRHRLATPRHARVHADPADGRPLVVDGREVDAVRESWLVEDRWWTEQPLRRRYWEVVTTCGRNVVAFHDLRDGGWHRQR